MGQTGQWVDRWKLKVNCKVNSPILTASHGHMCNHHMELEHEFLQTHPHASFIQDMTESPLELTWGRGSPTDYRAPGYR